MKKLLVVILAFILIGGVSGTQDYLYIHQKGGAVQKIELSTIDSISFVDATLLNGVSLQGFAQKGPFINGSSVTIYDLKSDLTPSGKTFNTQIKDNKGTFGIDNISLSSNFVSLRTDGFYYNEVLGKQSVSQITLYALTDITDHKNVNINLLTHLEKPRVEYLMKTGLSFSDSKKQAQKEILAIFNIVKAGINNSEDLNIAMEGADNGILLAISSILQGYRSESEMTELLSNISEDIRTDGVLNSSFTGSDLINHALFLDTLSIKTKLTNRYNAIGASSNVPSFGAYIENFIAKTHFVSTESLFTYPSTGNYGINLLALSDSIYTGSPNTTFSFAAQIPTGMSLKIRITSIPDTIYNGSDPIGNPSDTTVVVPRDSISITYHEWFYSLGGNTNWVVSVFSRNPNTQTFTANSSGISCDLMMLFPESGRFLIEYFENNATVARRKKIIKLVIG